MTTVRGDKVSAVDLGEVVLINSETSVNNQDVLTNQDLQYQEDRRKRKIRKLNFEVRWLIWTPVITTIWKVKQSSVLTMSVRQCWDMGGQMMEKISQDIMFKQKIVDFSIT